MKRVCAWCGKHLGDRPSGRSGASISHGICRNCLHKFVGSAGIELDRFLDAMDAPVVLVDETGNVKTANRQARSLLKKELAQGKGYCGSEVFQCAYARVGMGCGKDVHCSGCAIRRTVMDTLQSGASHQKVPAYLDAGTPDDYQRVSLLISTQKVDDVVLLSIDQFGDDRHPAEPGDGEKATGK